MNLVILLFSLEPCVYNSFSIINSYKTKPIMCSTSNPEEKEVSSEFEFSEEELLPDAADLIAVILENNLKPAYAEEYLTRANHQLWQAAAKFNQMLADNEIPPTALNV